MASSFIIISHGRARSPTQLEKNLLRPSRRDERRRHKLKRLVQNPDSYYMDVKCPSCSQIKTIFSHAQTVVTCSKCGAILVTPTGGRARLAHEAKYRIKID